MIQQLRLDLAAIDDRIRIAAVKNAQLTGGLVKSLVEAQLQVALLTREVIVQRIAALESDAVMTVQLPATVPNPERAAELESTLATKRAELAHAAADAEHYSGGLVAALKHTTVATIEQTIAALDLDRLCSLYGLAIPPMGMPGGLRPNAPSESAPPAPKTPSPPVQPANTQMVIPHISNKRHEDSTIGPAVLFDVVWHARQLSKAARMIKGTLLFKDLLDETQFALNVTIDKPLLPSRVLKNPGLAFEFNRFMNDHRWVLNTDLTNIRIAFHVRSILYEDGTRSDFP